MVPDFNKVPWSEIRHAYGSAINLPPYLKRIHEDPCTPCAWDEEPWPYLWSSLCHQGSIYPASIAAVPYIVGAAFEAVRQDKIFVWGCIGLPVAIQKARKRHPALQVDQAYDDALASINDLIDYTKGKQVDRALRRTVREAERLLINLKLRQPPQQEGGGGKPSAPWLPGLFDRDGAP